MSRSPHGPSFPPPPWHTFAEGAATTYLVSARSVCWPAGFRPVSVLGRATGLLAYLRYLPPSPLLYDELIWIPAMVRAGGSLGWFVEKMYVNDETSLRAGRAEWALPKSLARFERRGDRVDFEAADGTRARFRLQAWGPQQRVRSRLATLQARGGDVLRFACTFDGRVQLGGLTVESFEPGGDGWASFQGARRLRPGGRLTDARATMHEAQVLSR